LTGKLLMLVTGFLNTGKEYSLLVFVKTVTSVLTGFPCRLRVTGLHFTPYCILRTVLSKLMFLSSSGRQERLRTNIPCQTTSGNTCSSMQKSIGHEEMVLDMDLSGQITSQEPFRQDISRTGQKYLSNNMGKIQDDLLQGSALA